jgi:hypothetical protein
MAAVRAEDCSKHIHEATRKGSKYSVMTYFDLMNDLMCRPRPKVINAQAPPVKRGEEKEKG